MFPPFITKVMSVCQQHSGLPNSFCLLRDDNEIAVQGEDEGLSLSGRRFAKEIRLQMGAVGLSEAESAALALGDSVSSIDEMAVDQLRVWQAGYLAEKCLKKFEVEQQQVSSVFLSHQSASDAEVEQIPLLEKTADLSSTATGTQRQLDTRVPELCFSAEEIDKAVGDVDLKALLELQAKASAEMKPVHDKDPRYVSRFEAAGQGKKRKLTQTIRQYPTLKLTCVGFDLPISMIDLDRTTFCLIGKYPASTQMHHYFEMLLETQPPVIICVDVDENDFLKPESTCYIPKPYSVSSGLLESQQANGTDVKVYKIQIDKEDEKQKCGYAGYLIHIKLDGPALKTVGISEKINIFLTLLNLLSSMLNKHNVDFEKALFHSVEGVGYNAVLCIMSALLKSECSVEQILIKVLYARNHCLFGAIDKKVLSNKEILTLVSVAGRLCKAKTMPAESLPFLLSGYSEQALCQTVKSITSRYTIQQPDCCLKKSIINPKFVIDCCNGLVFDSPKIHELFIAGHPVCYFGDNAAKKGLNDYLGFVFNAEPSVVVMTGDKYHDWFNPYNNKARTSAWNIEVKVCNKDSDSALSLYQVTLMPTSLNQVTKPNQNMCRCSHQFYVIKTNGIVSTFNMLCQSNGTRVAISKLEWIMQCLAKLLPLCRKDDIPLFQCDKGNVDALLLSVVWALKTQNADLTSVFSALIALIPQKFLTLQQGCSLVDLQYLTKLITTWMKTEKMPFHLGVPKSELLVKAIIDGDQSQFDNLLKQEGYNLVSLSSGSASALSVAASMVEEHFIIAILAYLGIEYATLLTTEQTQVKLLAQQNNFRALVVRFALLTEERLNSLTDENGNNQLHYLAEYDPHNKLEIYLGYDYSPLNKKNHQGETPLLMAIKHQNWIFVKSLLKITSVDVSVKDAKGKTIHSLLSGHDNELAKGCLNLLELRRDFIFSSDGENKISANYLPSCLGGYCPDLRNITSSARNLINSGLNSDFYTKLNLRVQGLKSTYLTRCFANDDNSKETDIVLTTQNQNLGCSIEDKDNSIEIDDSNKKAKKLLKSLGAKNLVSTSKVALQDEQKTKEKLNVLCNAIDKCLADNNKANLDRLCRLLGEVFVFLKEQVLYFGDDLLRVFFELAILGYSLEQIYHHRLRFTSILQDLTPEELAQVRQEITDLLSNLKRVFNL